jgi:hypothetical protein
MDMGMSALESFSTEIANTDVESLARAALRLTDRNPRYVNPPENSVCIIYIDLNIQFGL